ncbi:hypothetical protein POF50_029605 [Streptomyces sp. SL13]|jgi:hypothetical protein|uniref:SH3 domain-containing protein n=1 Tax=Streptantibioticus silvisoli TaxID=2705255 RepID=A0AA90H977_9ACTN|nr:hypothetical protein [Streptantibioticus silvisoli]MDI5964520.1 hypothetical protein [Streptantibioticus silvisoli]MDI5973450.1 hypothetical protein [Streptantibioticus silvisoli]
MFARATRTVAAGALAAGLFSALVTPVAAHAATTSVSPQTTRRSVCAQDVYLRETPEGVSIGLLDQGDTFDQERLSPSGEWAYGMAYGNADKHGWVMESALC